MNCKHCLTENPEGSVFCMNCGSRLDGTVTCSACGTKCPDNARFCISCGTPLYQKPVSKAHKAKTDAPSEDGPIWRKVKYAFDLSGGICAIVAVFFALVFTFFIGTSTTVQYETEKFSQTNTLWYFFGAAYKNIASMLDNFESYSFRVPITYYLPVILSTVVMAATIVSVSVLAILSAVKYANHFKNPESSYANYAAAAVFCYLLGAVLMLGMTNMSLRSSSSHMSLSPSATTIAGIVLSCIFLGLYFACKIVTLGKTLAKKNTIVSLVCTVVGSVTAILATVFAARFAASISTLIDTSYYQTTYTATMNFAYLNTAITSIYEAAEGAGEGFASAYTLNVLTYFIQIALPAIGVAVLIKRIGHFGEKDCAHLGIAIAFAAVAIVYLIFACVSVQLTAKYIQSVYSAAESGIAKISITAAPVVTLVMALLNLAAAIVHKALNANLNQNMQIPAMPYYGEIPNPVPQAPAPATTDPAEQTDN